MAGRQRYTVEQVITALREGKGMVSVAARRLGYNFQTVLNYCKRYPTVEQAKQESRVELLDEAELRLWRAIRRDESWAITLALKTIGRSRGYGERLDLNVSIHAAASKVAAEFGLSVTEVLNEARLLLMEVDDEH
jgi:hypothetical protein